MTKLEIQIVQGEVDLVDKAIPGHSVIRMWDIHCIVGNCAKYNLLLEKAKILVIFTFNSVYAFGPKKLR
jgi:hypothetical protein